MRPTRQKLRLRLRSGSIGLVVFLIVSLPSQGADGRWTRFASAHFELLTTRDGKEARETIRNFEHVRQFFLEASPVGAAREPDSGSPLRIAEFEDRTEYERIRPGGVAAAFFVAAPEREYIVLGDRTLKDRRFAIHEYVHVAVRRTGLRLPVWLNEGWAEVFSTLHPMGKEMAVGDLIPERIETLKKDRWLDFGELTSVDTNSALYNEASRVGIFYAESWALAHMLFLSPEYKDNFPKFVTALHNGKRAAEACRMAFGRSSDEILADLHAYFERKRLYGTAFNIGADREEVAISSASMADYDVRLVRAELLIAAHKRAEGLTEYSNLASEQPERTEVLRALGDIAFEDRDSAKALSYYRRAFDAGDGDPRMCLRLARLSVAEKAEPAKVIPVLERGLGSKSNFPEAEALLGALKLEMRDYAGAVSILTGIASVPPEEASAMYCGLALAQIQLGDVADAGESLATCRKWTRSDADRILAEQIGRFVEARSQPAAAVQFGEKHQRVTGMLGGVECSLQGNRLLVIVNGKLAKFDLPPADAIEMPAKPAVKFSLQCGAMSPVPIAVEFAPPRSAIETSAGVVRRLVF